MQLKIGDKIFKDTDVPVGIFLTPRDRLNIIAMQPDRNFYCSYPQGTSEEEVKKFMTIPAPEQPKNPDLKPVGE